MLTASADQHDSVPRGIFPKKPRHDCAPPSDWQGRYSNELQAVMERSTIVGIGPTVSTGVTFRPLMNYHWTLTDSPPHAEIFTINIGDHSVSVVVDRADGLPTAVSRDGGSFDSIQNWSEVADMIERVLLLGTPDIDGQEMLALLLIRSLQMRPNEHARPGVSPGREKRAA